MIEIKDLLLKFGDLLLKEELKKDLIREIISKAINLPIKTEDIKIKKGIVFLNIKPIYKNEIILKKDEILIAFKKAIGEKAPEKII